MTCLLVSANSYGFLKTVLYFPIVSSQVVSRAWIWRQCKIMNIYLLQWKVQCLWLGREMVFSDSPDGLGPAASALGVLGREVFAGCSPSGGCVARAEPTCQPRNRPRVGVLEDSQQTWECACTMKDAAGYFALHPCHSQDFFLVSKAAREPRNILQPDPWRSWGSG